MGETATRALISKRAAPRKAQGQVADAQFADATIEGLGFRVDGDGGFEGKTDAAGKFRFVVGRPVQFFLDSGGDRLVIGTATPAAVSGGVTPFTLHDLAETQNDGDEYLGNLVNLLAALDANADLSDGVVLDANAQAAVATAAARQEGQFRTVGQSLREGLGRDRGDGGRRALADQQR